MNKKYLGKITSIDIELMDSRVSLCTSFEFTGGCTCSSVSYWSKDIDPFPISKYTEWTEDDRVLEKVRLLDLVEEILTKSKKRRLSQLKNCPVEIEFKDNYLVSWRILEEVL